MNQLNDTVEQLTIWIDRLQHVQEAVIDPDKFGQEVVQDLLTDLSTNPILGNVFRLRMDTGYAIRITVEMCVVE